MKGAACPINYNVVFPNNNLIYHNNLVNNAEQAAESNSTNIWHSGYPSGGNYWSNYNGTDQYSGPSQNETGGDGIGDTPYIIPYLNSSDRYPLMKPYGVQHDIGITSITTSKTIIGQSYSLRINIRIVNYGVDTENFNVTAYANTTIIETILNITLTSRNFATIIFKWNTTGFAKGNYIIWAYATPVPSETDTADNTLINGIITVTIPGDVNGDFYVEIYDIVKICWAYNTKQGDSRYKPNLDIDGDEDIDIYDVTKACTHFNEKYP